MARENFMNFATTALVSPSPLTSSGTSFTVTAGQGSLFPASNFLVTIEAEVVLISSRSGDTFTVQTRGFDGTTAASHNAGVTIQLAICAYNLVHIWQNIADTFSPIVPPVQQPGGLSPSQWDNEFESLGSWTLYPSGPSGGSVWNVNSTLRSHLVASRGTTDNTLYTAYIPFNPPASTPYMVTCKLSEAISFAANNNSGNGANFWFQVTDQTNPTASYNSGNRWQIKFTLFNTTKTADTNVQSSTQDATSTHQVIAHNIVSGSYNRLGTTLLLPIGTTIYARIYNDGNGNWTGYVGDGIVYWPLYTQTGFSFTPQTIALQFTSTSLGVNHAIDFIRVATGSGLNPSLGY